MQCPCLWLYFRASQYTPEPVNPHVGHPAKEQLGKHGGSCLSPEHVGPWNRSVPPLPPASAVPKSHLFTLLNTSSAACYRRRSRARSALLLPCRSWGLPADDRLLPVRRGNSQSRGSSCSRDSYPSTRACLTAHLWRLHRRSPRPCPGTYASSLGIRSGSHRYQPTQDCDDDNERPQSLLGNFFPIRDTQHRVGE